MIYCHQVFSHTRYLIDFYQREYKWPMGGPEDRELQRKRDEHFGWGSGKRKGALSALFEGDEPEIDRKEDLTGANIVANYEVVARRLDQELGTEHRLQTFIYYFLHRLVLVRLNVEQDDVAMVFEVINDRGIGLKAHEILKGKLLGTR